MVARSAARYGATMAADVSAPRPGRRSNRFEGPRYALVTVAEARDGTGLERDELIALPGVEAFTRIYADGRREEALRVPAELVAS
jgi:hypothetical protein